MKKVEFYKHNVSLIDIQNCVKVLKSYFLTTGAQVKTFEEKLSNLMEAKYAVGVTSCTDALFLALKCVGVAAGDEVITTPLSFIASSNVIEYCGAKPIYVDCEESTGNINANLIEKAITKKTKAILVVHLYGQMCDMRKIKQIANKYKLKVIEDAAHCLEGRRDNVRVGELADIACFSFYATKNITSGEGGALTTNNAKYYEWLSKARLHGMSKGAMDRYTKKYEHYDMEFLGYKCNMNNIQASLLLHQLDKMDIFLRKKEKIAAYYDKGFRENPQISTPTVLPNTTHARHLYTIWVDPKKRDMIMHQLQEEGVGVAVNFRPIHLMHYYKSKYRFKSGMFPVAERIGSSTITLPFYPKLKKTEIDYVIKKVTSSTLPLR